VVTTNDEPHQRGTNGAEPSEDRPPSSVAQEAALLVDLLSRRGWGTGSGMPSASSHAHAPAAGPAAVPDDATAGADDAGVAGESDPSSPPADTPLTGDGSVRECTCGGQQPAACRVCPVCQLIAFVQQVNPDTIERVADFVGFAATALRDLATAQRDRTTAVPHGPDDDVDDGTADPGKPGGSGGTRGTGDGTGEDRA